MIQELLAPILPLSGESLPDNAANTKENRAKEQREQDWVLMTLGPPGSIGRGAETAPVLPSTRGCGAALSDHRREGGPPAPPLGVLPGLEGRGVFAEAQAASPRPWTEKTWEGGGEA